MALCNLPSDDQSIFFFFFSKCNLCPIFCFIVVLHALGRALVSIEKIDNELAELGRLREILGVLFLEDGLRFQALCKGAQSDPGQSHVVVDVQLVVEGGVDESGQRRSIRSQRVVAGGKGAHRVVELESHRLLFLVNDVSLPVLKIFILKLYFS